MKDPFGDTRLSNTSDGPGDIRLWPAALMVVAIFGIFTVRLFQLQILQGDDLASRSRANYVRTVRVEAQRGAIMSNLRAANPHEQLTFVLSRDDADKVWGIRTDDDNRVYGLTFDTPAAAVGLMPGDLIVRVGNQPVVGNVRGLILGKAYRAKLNLVVTVSRPKL